VAHETPHERGKRHLRQAGYKAGGVTLPKVKRVVKRALVGHEDAEHGGEHKPIKLRSGGPVHGHEAKHRPDRRARGVDGLGDWPNDAQGNENAKSALARGGAHKEHKGKGGKTVINIHQGDPQREQMAHQQGMQQGVQIGARAAAAKLAGAGAPPGGPPHPPMGGAPMMPPGGGMPPGMPPGGPPMAPQARPPMAGPPPGMPMRRAGGRV
jgi:hypothetical protein